MTVAAESIRRIGPDELRPNGVGLPPSRTCMSTHSSETLGTRWCPDCGNELSLTGVQRAGIAQFFCDDCRYRHDRYVGDVSVDA